MQTERVDNPVDPILLFLYGLCLHSWPKLTMGASTCFFSHALFNIEERVCMEMHHNSTSKSGVSNGTLFW